MRVLLLAEWSAALTVAWKVYDTAESMAEKRVVLMDEKRVDK